ncbi:MAG: tetratricopeptide repeat protein [Anaerolineae bacterium]|nr:tetratricopeptide repeat protein [Anaerolineae bacterium]
MSEEETSLIPGEALTTAEAPPTMREHPSIDSSFESDPHAEKLQALAATARELLSRRKWAEAERAYEQLLMLQQQAEDRIGIAQTKNDLASLFLAQQEWQKAIDLLERSRAVFEEAGDPEQEAVALNNLAAAQYELGQTEQSLANYEKALAMRHDMGDRVGEAKTLRNLGILYAKQGNTNRAKLYLNRAIGVARQANAGELVKIIRKSLSQLPRR